MSDQKSSKQWILPLLIIPLLLLLFTAYLVLNYANGRPIFSLPFSSEEVADQQVTSTKNADVEQRLKLANAEIKKLRTKTTDQADIIQAKEQEVVRLIAERDRLKKTPATPAVAADETTTKKKTANVTDVYAEMPPKDAANILNELSPTEVVPIIQKIEAEQQAAIMAKMDPKKAAALTQLLAVE
ncbi:MULTISPECIES: MotE family protein [Exiguobacterium]|uniref:Magnesium transporter MgtE n=1 Tax=Exiguobacterium antarcticum TaxID=132920 RepID=A0ABT6QYT3_9BACL|nr:MULTISPECIES: MgtE intracellular domain-containing protein [Exiguobacterium]AFS70833.1 MgtE intracellular N domain protein [Exiguobacterium antarcticum B7]MCT4781092.1 magnesium transporter MgtE [Exiguobacterium soli]MDI3233854.1 magnesium transporter MgtE [Exiguobacterium antarcticum]